MCQFLGASVEFPPPEAADETGLIAIGGDLSILRLLSAYRNGIFPWGIYGGHIMWYCPHPRLVLFPDELKISKSMYRLLKLEAFEFTINKDFEAVIRNCKDKKREGQEGSWISEEFIEAYSTMNQNGYAVSAETRINGTLVGGLYGIRLGKVFFGESMFSGVSNASKYAFIKFVEHLRAEGVELIDCQIYTEHLASLGAREITRNEFLDQLKLLL